MPIHLHRNSSLSALADELAEHLAADPLDVFASELIVTGAPGVERWLTQQLAHRLGRDHGDDGVSAGLRVMSPHSLTSLLLGREHDDPWLAHRLTWPVLTAMDDLVTTPGFETLARHLGVGDPLTSAPEGAGPDVAGSPASPRQREEEWHYHARRTRRFAVARRVAGLFARYLDDRPELLRAWEASDTSSEVPADFAWQPVLWREVVRHVLASGAADRSPVARHDAVISAIRDGQVPAELPPRLTLFGHTRLSPSSLDLLEALATQRQVHLWLPHPSPTLWSRLAAHPSPPHLVRHADDSDSLARHPLLATLGRDVRELEQTLLHREVTDATPTPEAADKAPVRSRLALLQADIRANRPVSATPTIPADDLSIQVHACHGPARQVEALREMLVWLIDHSDGEIQPRDILVMCPDIETFAPLLKATFATTPDEVEQHPGQSLRLQLADRGLDQTNAFAQVAQGLLELVSGRLTTSQVLDFLELPAVATKFALDAEKMERLAQWVEQSGARWGLNARHRAEFRVGGLDNNTWEQALDRLALGIAVGADTDAGIGSAAPLDDVPNSDIDLAARLLEIFEILTNAWRAVRSQNAEHPHLAPGVFTAQQWQDWLRTYTLQLAQVPVEQQWQQTQFEREIANLAPGEAQSSALRLTDVRVLLESTWAPRPSRANFRNGAISVCTMTPMRSVPHKAVVMLGLDDGVLPRTQVADGDDLLARAPRVGERDIRSEDQQVVLDALMAASDYFIAFYSGFDERSGASRPPCVPLQEVIAAASRTGAGPESAQTSAPVSVQSSGLVRQHPLQSFDERNFTAQTPIPGGSYDVQARLGANAARQAQAATAGLSMAGLSMATRLDPPELTDLTVDDLVRMLHNPAREFLRRRVGVTVPLEAEEPQDDIPLTLDGLQEWTIGDRLLSQALDGMDLHRAYALERERGSVPPDPLGDPLNTIANTVASMLSQLPAAHRESVEVALDLTMGPAQRRVRLSGVISGVVRSDAGDEISIVTYSRLGPKQLLEGWVMALALSAADLGSPVRAAIRTKDGAAYVVAPPAAQARQELSALLELYRNALSRPVPLPVRTAHSYAQTVWKRSRHAGFNAAQLDEQARVVADKRWAGQFGERDDRWWQELAGADADLSVITEQDGFAAMARNLWFPILDATVEAVE